MSRTNEELLADARGHFLVATQYQRRPDADEELVLDALTMRLFAGLELLTRLPEDVAQRLFDTQWPNMRGLRHRIAHGYGAVNLRRVRSTVADKLPAVLAAIEDELSAR